MLRNKAVQIVLMFVALAVLAFVVQWILGMDVMSETFYNPDDCKNICAVNTNKSYCNSPYLKDGSSSRCNCSWDDSTRTCKGSNV